jgi:hypothetical protein
MLQVLAVSCSLLVSGGDLSTTGGGTTYTAIIAPRAQVALGRGVRLVRRPVSGSAVCHAAALPVSLKTADERSVLCLDPTARGRREQPDRKSQGLASGRRCRASAGGAAKSWKQQNFAPHCGTGHAKPCCGASGTSFSRVSSDMRQLWQRHRQSERGPRHC